MHVWLFYRNLSYFAFLIWLLARQVLLYIVQKFDSRNFDLFDVWLTFNHTIALLCSMKSTYTQFVRVLLVKISCMLYLSRFTIKLTPYFHMPSLLSRSLAGYCFGKILCYICGLS